MDKEAWVNTKPSHVDPATEPSEGTDSGFLGSISRGTPRPREAMAADLANKAPRRRKPALNLPEGQQPSIDDIYSHTQGDASIIPKPAWQTIHHISVCALMGEAMH